MTGSSDCLLLILSVSVPGGVSENYLACNYMPWGLCSKSCGGGSQVRGLTTESMILHKCPRHLAIQRRSCNEQSCGQISIQDSPTASDLETPVLVAPTSPVKPSSSSLKSGVTVCKHTSCKYINGETTVTENGEFSPRHRSPELSNLHAGLWQNISRQNRCTISITKRE